MQNRLVTSCVGKYKVSYSIKYLLLCYYHKGHHESQKYVDNSLNMVNAHDVSPFHEALHVRGNMNANRITKFYKINNILIIVLEIILYYSWLFSTGQRVNIEQSLDDDPNSQMAGKYLSTRGNFNVNSNKRIQIYMQQ